MFVCHCMLLCKTGLFYICAIPIPILISTPKRIPFPWNFHTNTVPMGIPIPTHTSAMQQRNIPCVVDDRREPLLMRVLSTTVASSVNDTDTLCGCGCGRSSSTSTVPAAGAGSSGDDDDDDNDSDTSPTNLYIE